MQGFNINKTVNPKGLKKDEYDAIIIGAGIGGLVCGCYLAKAGLKVLIVEKNDKVGGYCTSFEREGFKFDVGIRALGSMREGGRLNIIFNELNLFKKIDIIRTDPYDIIITDKKRINIWNDSNKVLDEFQSNFPKESNNIKKFFDFIVNTNSLNIYLELKDKTFDYVIDKFLKSPEIKNIIYLLLQNVALPTYEASALSTTFMFREHILDGGYYPLGGMQRLPDTLADSFKKSGGTLLLSTRPKRIVVKDKQAKGIILQKDIYRKGSYIILASDITNTFLSLIDEEVIDKIFLKKILNMRPSHSAFVVYLGINQCLKKVLGNFSGIWYAPFYLECNERKNVKDRTPLDKFPILLCAPSLHSTITKNKKAESIFIFINAPFKDINFWNNNKDIIMQRMIKRAEEIIPNLQKHIVSKTMATPHDFYRYTLNRDGAIRGWASIPLQISKSILPKKVDLDGLYSVGQWASQMGQGGVILAANSGRSVAKTIEKQIKNKAGT